MEVTRAAVDAAARRIRGHVRVTPVVALDPGRPEGPGPRAWAKLEHHQRSGSFKARGAFANLLAARERGDLDRGAGVVIASGGNAGLATADAAAALGVRATVVVPEPAPAVKVERLRAVGATVLRRGAEYAEAYDAAVAEAARTGALLAHAYDQPEVVAGAGTLALEALEQLPGGLDTIVVAVGGGGLLAGIVAATGRAIRVVGVEPVRAPTLHAALAAGRPVDVEVGGVAADALGARRIGRLAWSAADANRGRVEAVLVDDAALVGARSELWASWRIPVEHAAAAPLAALRTGAYRPADGERVLLVLCGGNTDPATLAGPARPVAP